MADGRGVRPGGGARGVRGIVVGDTFRRAVSRAVAQQIAESVERATAPFQYALSTRSGTVCVANAIQALTDLNPDSTVWSVDGIGKFDLVSREAMLSGLRTTEGGDTLLPFVSQFYGRPSQYLWEDDEGVCHHSSRGRERTRRLSLMSALYALGQHSAVVAVQESMQPTERLMAFLDDIYLVSQPERTAVARRELGGTTIVDTVRDPAGRTQIWNKSGDAHQVVKSSSRQQESQTPKQRCGKVTRVYRRTGKESSSWVRRQGMHISLPENCWPRQRSTQFCSAEFSLCRISSVHGFFCCFCAATWAIFS